MEENEEVFRHPPLTFVVTGAGILVFGALAFVSGYLFFYLIPVFFILLTLHYAMSSVRVSNQGITTTGLLGSKSIAWPDIAYVSTRSPAVELHHRDGILKMSIEGNVRGYSEILEILSKKRPDLIDGGANDPIAHFELTNRFQVGVGIVLIAIAIFLFFIAGRSDTFVASIVALLIGISLTVNWYLSPQSISLEGRHLRVRYPRKEIIYSVDEIQSVDLEKQLSRYGFLYFIQIRLKTGKKLKLRHHEPNRVYLVLRKWQAKFSKSKDSSPVQAVPGR